MRFLADAGISPNTIDFLRRNGHDAVHVRELAGLNCFHAACGSGHGGSIVLALLSFLARTLALTQRWCWL